MFSRIDKIAAIVVMGVHQILIWSPARNLKEEQLKPFDWIKVLTMARRKYLHRTDIKYLLVVFYSAAHIWAHHVILIQIRHRCQTYCICICSCICIYIWVHHVIQKGCRDRCQSNLKTRASHHCWPIRLLLNCSQSGGLQNRCAHIAPICVWQDAVCLHCHWEGYFLGCS